MRILKGYRLKPILLGLISLCGFLVANITIAPQAAKATGETYTWVDLNTIQVSGGNLIGTTKLPAVDAGGQDF